MKDPSGRMLSGLPNPADHGDAVERAVDAEGRALQRDANGIDPEGLAALADGTFWVSEEYGPYLVHLDPSGREIERLSPFRRNQRGHALPKVLSRRRPNYGIEGLSVTPDGTTLVAIMQSALDNPDRDVRARTRATRLVTVDLKSGATRQFVYLRESAELSVTDIAAVSGSVFLIIERDDKFPDDPNAPAQHKRVYRVDISHVTDVSDSSDGVGGKLFDGKTLEQLADSELSVAGITAAPKRLAVDLLALPRGYSHDKPEGIAVVGDQLIAVSNDDDFGVDAGPQGTVIRKTIPGTGVLDQNEIYFIRVDRPK